MGKDLAAAARALHNTLMAGIAKDEAQAQECAAMADLAEQDGNQGFAEVLRSLSRKHRVKVLELTGKLAPLNAEFENMLRPKT